ncbi:DUF305 domain-containing protein [Janibacter sp. G1551]|uniref:DUF305 domain-containing protein n=1 Tax=Janibacter sp. G1551 TaxID=3420440 RepID=UPI003D0563EB
MPPAPRSPRRPRLMAAAAAALVLAGTSACTENSGTAAPPTSTATSPDAPVLQPGRPGESNASLTGDDAVNTPSKTYTRGDVSFVQDMIVHHAQAIRMSTIAKGRFTDDEVSRIASRIAAEQGPESEAMATWLENNDEDVPPQAENPNFDAGHEGHGMAGMASPDQLRELEQGRGVDLDLQYLTLMIAHHEGALDMVVERSRVGRDVWVERLGDDIVATQQAQINHMERMRARLS